ncbi:hypothetical protein [Mucilaginibacter psychrotolerans]|uniref:Uncharacterized protein n=1 Tax=Mucilaginibacter psychrotolerans TaxID=1524096 RepID=A0A4Y8SIK7_9SPHI|nr:hypothetical protein [Mucilaginibacter psychrotolerans]TFF38758.1 hypothetical protein E2R66_07060 [Mucilaginibacter psychrotolerans]
MTATHIFAFTMLGIALLLIFGVIFFSILKYIQRRYYPSWKFPDYISVGYADYLYHKFIKKDLK